MKEQRFDWSNNAARLHEEKRNQEVRALLSEVGATNKIERALRDALTLPEPKASARLFAKVTGPLLSSGEDTQILEALTRTLELERTDEPWMRAARHLIGRVLGGFVAEQPPSADTFDAAALRAEHCAEWSSFADAFESRAGELVRKEGWLAELSRPMPPNEYLLEYRRLSTESLMPPVSVEQVWREGWVSMPLGAKASYRLSALACWGGEAIARVLSVLPNVPLQRAALEHMGTRDRDFLLEAIRLAPAIFEDGKFRNAAGLLLAEAYVAHGSNLSEVMEQGVRNKIVTSEELETLRNHEIPMWFESLAAAILCRNDGIRLMLEFGAELARRAALPSGVARHKWLTEAVALATLAEKTIGLPPAWRVLQELVENSRGFGFLMLAAYSAGQSEGTVEARSWVWKHYIDALVRNDPALEKHVNPFGAAEEWVFIVFALALRAEANFDGTWHATWRLPAMEGLRAKSRFGRNHEAAASLHLIRVGFAALTVNPDDAEARRRLWQLVFEAAVVLMVSQQSAILSWSYRNAATAFAHLPHLFGDQWRGVLEQQAPLLRSDARLVLNAAALLTMNGIPRTEVIHAFTHLGLDPLAVGHELVEWDGDRAGPGETNARDLLAWLLPPDTVVARHLLEGPFVAPARRLQRAEALLRLCPGWPLPRRRHFRTTRGISPGEERNTRSANHQPPAPLRADGIQPGQEGRPLVRGKPRRECGGPTRAKPSA